MTDSFGTAFKRFILALDAAAENVIAVPSLRVERFGGSEKTVVLVG